MPAATSVPPPERVNVVRRGTGIPMVMIHGNGVDHRLLLPLDDDLEAVGGLERVYLDLPGFGASTALPGAGGLPEYADWACRQIQLLLGETPFALVANSMGGLLARHVRAQFPHQVLGLALLAPIVNPNRAERKLPGMEVIDSDTALLSSLAAADREEFTAMAARQTRQTWELFERFALPGIRAADPEAMERLATRYELDEVPELAGTTCLHPTLIITGRQDHVVGFVDQFSLLEHYPRATYAALDGAGHNVHLDQPAVVQALLRQWAREVLQYAAARTDRAG